MKDKKLIVLIVLGALAMFSIVYGLISPTKAEREAKKDDETTQEQSGKAGEIVLHERQTERTKYKTYKRNVFVPKGSTKANKLILDGIMWSEQSPKAMIDNEIVGVGEKIGTNTVVDIKPDQVILNNGAEDFAIKLPE